MMIGMRTLMTLLHSFPT